MSFFFGLYFGDTNLCIAVCRAGQTEVIANYAGDRVTPSYISFVNDEKLVGLAAKQGALRNASNTVTRVKSLLFRNKDVIEEIIKESQCQITEEGGLKYLVTIGDKTKDFSPFEGLVSSFKNMADIAKSYSHNDDIPSVITVPLGISATQKEIVTMAASDAGFDVLRIVSEPAAAALSYEIGQESNEEIFHCLVYRMGGHSLDVTVIRVTCGIYHVLESTKRDFGGKLFTRHLMEFCSGEFYRQFKLDVTESRRSEAKLLSACEICKHVLSTMGTAKCFAESLCEGVDLNVNVSQARFDSLITCSLQQCLEPINEVLEKVQLTKQDIRDIVLAGGSCKIPKLQQHIAEMFPSSRCLTTISPDEVIAIGAAKEAELISQTNTENMSIEKDCYIDTIACTISLKIHKVDGKVCMPLLHKHTPVPAFKQLSFEINGKEKTELEIFQEEIDADNLTGSSPLAKLTMPMTSAKELTISVWVSCEQTIKIQCKDNSSTLKKSVTIMPKN